MIDGNLINRIDRIGGPYGDRECFYTCYEFTVPTVLANDYSRFRFLIGKSIGIEVLKVYCESTKYSFEIFNKENFHGAYKVVSLTDINKWVMIGGSMGENGTYLTVNRDQPSTDYVYAEIVNSDSVATGTIYVEFMVSDI